MSLALRIARRWLPADSGSLGDYERLATLPLFAAGRKDDALRLLAAADARVVAGYDPTTNVVICFVRKDGEEKTDIDAYNIQTRPAPPLAAERGD